MWAWIIAVALAVAVTIATLFAFATGDLFLSLSLLLDLGVVGVFLVQDWALDQALDHWSPDSRPRRPIRRR